MTDLERIGQRLVTGFPGTALTPELVQVVKEYKIGKIACRICLYRPATFLPCHHQAG